MINILFIDKDSDSRLAFAQYIQEIQPHSYVQHSCATAEEARQVLLHQKIDVVFLDITMKDSASHLLFAGLKYKKPHLIAMAADKESARDAWERGDDNFILKPLQRNALLAALQRVKHLPVRKAKETRGENCTLFVRERYGLTRVNVKDIYLVEAQADYIHLHSLAKKYSVHFTMKGMLEKLPEKLFARVHSSFIVRLDSISVLGQERLMVENRFIPVSRQYRNSLRQQLRLI